MECEEDGTVTGTRGETEEWSTTREEEGCSDVEKGRGGRVRRVSERVNGGKGREVQKGRGRPYE